LLRPKYCADAGDASASVSAAVARGTASGTIVRGEVLAMAVLLVQELNQFRPSSHSSPANLDAGSAVRLRGAILRDRRPHFVFGRRLGARALRVADGVDRAAGEILADEILDQDRQELALAERRVRLAHRGVDRR